MSDSIFADMGPFIAAMARVEIRAPTKYLGPGLAFLAGDFGVPPKDATSAANNMEASNKNAFRQRMAAARTRRLCRTWVNAILLINTAIFIIAPFVPDDDSPWLLALALALVVPVPVVLFLLLRHWRMPD